MADLGKLEQGYKELRKGRRSVAGGLYFITTNIRDRRPVLKDPSSAQIVKDSIQWMESSGRWTWITYVLMPDHLHLVVRLGKVMSLDRCMMTFKSFTATRLMKLLGLEKAIWQDGYFDHKVRSDGKYFEVLFYIYWNPVKAGFVEPFATDFQHWGCKEPYRRKLIDQFDWLKRKYDRGLLWKPKRRRR